MNRPVGRSRAPSVPPKEGEGQSNCRDAACRVISQAVGTAPILPLQGAGGPGVRGEAPFGPLLAFGRYLGLRPAIGLLLIAYSRQNRQPVRVWYTLPVGFNR